MSRWLVVLGIAVLVLLGVLYWKMSDKPEDPAAMASQRGGETDIGAKAPPSTTPDARAQYVASSPSCRCSGSMRPGRPLVLSSRPEGPVGTDPHVELSLGQSVFAPGDTLRGAVALTVTSEAVPG